MGRADAGPPLLFARRSNRRAKTSFPADVSFAYTLPDVCGAAFAVKRRMCAPAGPRKELSILSGRITQCLCPCINIYALAGASHEQSLERPEALAAHVCREPRLHPRRAALSLP